MSAKRVKKTVLFKSGDNLSLLFFPVTIAWLEIIFRIFVTKTFSEGILISLFFACTNGLIMYILSTISPSTKANRIIAGSLCGLVTVWFGVQLVYHKIFRVLISINSVVLGAGQVTFFWKQALLGIAKSIPALLLFFIPFVLYIIFCKKKNMFNKGNLRQKLAAGISSLVFYLLSLAMIFIGGTSPLSAYNVYFEENIIDIAAERLGVYTASRLDVEDYFFKRYGSFVPPMDPPPLDPPSSSEESSESSQESSSSEASGNESSEDESSQESSEPEKPIVYGDNILDIDFSSVKSEKHQKVVDSLNKYFASQSPTKKNAYTGMFEGCNLIYIVAESFSSYVIDEQRTPTLYKMANEGFVFNNFYNSLWGVSTLDGEYVACTGLIPKSGVWSMYQSHENYLPFTLGNIFSEQRGITSRAYHNHSYKYYNRHLSHPNLGYIFKAKGNGLDVKPTWPESDLEMMQLTIPEYINDETFHTYYLTVSGHMSYTWIGNYMSSKNKQYVKDLPYSQESLAYLACNMELEFAMQYLMEQLEEAGIAENTVIVLSPDHYPYGMEKSSLDELAGHEIEENFELYKNSLIIYKKGMEPVTVDKPCSSLDILPTVLNLFGFDYDSRLLSGKDILSDSEGLVIFNTRNFITEKGKFVASTGEIIGDLTEDEVDRTLKIINNKFYYAAKILETDYYRAVFNK